MGSIVVIATMVVVSGVKGISIFTQDTTIEIVEMYSPAVTLHESTSSPPSPEFDCVGRTDGSYADYSSNCRSFYVCKEGKTRRFWCSSGTFYNPTSRHCTPYRTAECGNVTTERKSEVICPSNGIYSDYGSNCRSFYVCKDGVVTNYTCPPRTKYDWRKGRCNPSYQVSCDVLTCDDKLDGVYPDVTSGCQRYYRCKDGSKEEFLCPSGKIYDKHQSTCVSSADGAVCSDSHFSCVDLPDGYYPDYMDRCRKFHLCIGGHFQSFHCPPGLIFSKHLLACDFSARVDCQPVSPCSGKADGVQPDYASDCREFAVCENGTSIRSGICPQGKILDPLTSTCQPSSMVNCQPVRDTQCGRKADGIYTDVESGCTAYYLCVKERVLVTSFCPEGTAFHEAAGKCLPSHHVSCGRVPRSSGHSCEDKVGLFPDFDSHCRQYHLCVYGLQKTFDCPEGFIFDFSSQRCLLSNNSQCLSPVLKGTFHCLPGDDGYYTEATDHCTTFHQCKRELGLTYECPKGQHFDPSRRICNHGDSHCPPQDTDFPLLATSVSQLIQWQFNCTGKANGVYTSDQCEVFYICVNEVIYSYACPPGSIFDHKLLLCRSGTCKTTGLVPWFEEQDFNCEDKKDSMYPDVSTHCRRYYICENGQPSAAYCPDGEAFDERAMTCVQAASINCTSSRPARANTLSRVKLSGRKLPVRLPHKQEHPPLPAFRCPLGETGFFPDYVSGCRKFHICFRKLKKSYTCPSILLFNPDTKSCDLPENVVCRPPEVITAVQLNCSDNPNVRVADRNTGCKKYYECVGNDVVAHTCPEGTIYSETEGRCGLKSKVFCGNIEEENNPNRSHAHGIPNRYVFSCVNRPDGFYPDFARDCHVFYRCIRGKKFSHYCKQGLLFDPTTGICQFEDTVVCSPPPSVEVT